MKISLASPVLALVAEIAVARNCKGGLNYCGSTLNRIGDYQEEMERACESKRMGCRGDHANDVLFECREGIRNNIYMINSCVTGCKDGGEGQSDHYY